MHIVPNRPRVAVAAPVALAVALAAGLAAPLAAQDLIRVPEGERAQLLIVGTYHFANPGLDVVQTEIGDVLAPEAQAEIAAIVDGLARFRPTRVGVEAEPEYAAYLDSLYAAWRDGRHELTRNEIQQLGFRLADRFGHERLYPIDHGGEFPYQALMEYAAQHDPEAAQFVQQALVDVTAEMNRRHRELSMREILRLDNEPRFIRQAHAFYVRVGQVGAFDGYVGADLLAAWYERNIRIFSHIQALAEPGERVLVIIGSGHVPILRELARFDPRIELLDALDYLPMPAATGR